MSSAMRRCSQAHDLGLLDFTRRVVDPRITFVRSGSRAYHDSDGLLKYAGTDVWPREYDPVTGVCMGRSVWPQRTNLMTRSEEVDHSSWTKLRCSANANAETAPDGATTADRIVEDATASNTHAIYQLATIAASTTYCVSVFVKPGTRSRIWLALGDSFLANSCRVQFNATTGAVITSASIGSGWAVAASGAEDVGNGYFRLWVRATSSTLTTGIFGIYLSNADLAFTYTGDGSSYLTVWGMQMEAGDFPSPYIPTTAAAVTRFQDKPQVLTLSSIGYNPTEWTIACEFLSRAPAVSSLSLWDMGNGTTGNRVLHYVPSTVRGFFSSDSTFVTSSAWAPSVRGKTAFGVKSADHALSMNGSSPGVNTSATLPTIDRLSIGMTPYSTISGLCGWMRWLRMLPRRISNAELQRMSS